MDVVLARVIFVTGDRTYYAYRAARIPPIIGIYLTMADNEGFTVEKLVWHDPSKTLYAIDTVTCEQDDPADRIKRLKDFTVGWEVDQMDFPRYFL